MSRNFFVALFLQYSSCISWSFYVTIPFSFPLYIRDPKTLLSHLCHNYPKRRQILFVYSKQQFTSNFYAIDQGITKRGFKINLQETPNSAILTVSFIRRVLALFVFSLSHVYYYYLVLCRDREPKHTTLPMVCLVVRLATIIRIFFRITTVFR